MKWGESLLHIFTLSSYCNVRFLSLFLDSKFISIRSPAQTIKSICMSILSMVSRIKYQKINSLLRFWQMAFLFFFSLDFFTFKLCFFLGNKCCGVSIFPLIPCRWVALLWRHCLKIMPNMCQGQEVIRNLQDLCITTILYREQYHRSTTTFTFTFITFSS